MSDMTFQHIADIVNDPAAIIFIRDESGRYVWVSESYGQQLPYTAEQVLGKTNRDLYGDNAAPWEIADGFARATHDFMTTAENLYDTRTKKWRKFISTKLMVRMVGRVYLVGISVEVKGTQAAAYERKLGEVRARLIEQMGLRGNAT